MRHERLREDQVMRAPFKEVRGLLIAVLAGTAFTYGLRYFGSVDALIAQNSMQAFSLGLGGTPGYLIGPLLVRGALDERGFRKALAQARKAEE